MVQQIKRGLRVLLLVAIMGIELGQFTGDGTDGSGQVINWADSVLDPLMVMLIRKTTFVGLAVDIQFSTPDLVDNHVDGMTVDPTASTTNVDTVSAIVESSMTISDGGADLFPNKSGSVVYYVAWGQGFEMFTTEYTGDGSTSLALTGFGFAPKVVFILEAETSDNVAAPGVFTTTDINADATGGYIKMANASLQENGVVSLDSDGITVSDNSADIEPNKLNQGYNLWAWG